MVFVFYQKMEGEPTGQVLTLWTTERRMDVHTDFSTGMLAHENSYLASIGQ